MLNSGGLGTADASLGVLNPVAIVVASRKPASVHVVDLNHLRVLVIQPVFHNL
jgi:hypothetical protein